MSFRHVKYRELESIRQKYSMNSKESELLFVMAKDTIGKKVCPWIKILTACTNDSPLTMVIEKYISALKHQSTKLYWEDKVLTSQHHHWSCPARA